MVLEVGGEEGKGGEEEGSRVKRRSGECRRINLTVLVGGGRGGANDIAGRAELGGGEGVCGPDDTETKECALDLGEADLPGALDVRRTDLESEALRAGEGDVGEGDGAEGGGKGGGEGDEVVSRLDEEARREVILGLEEGLRRRREGEQAKERRREDKPTSGMPIAISTRYSPLILIPAPQAHRPMILTFSARGFSHSNSILPHLPSLPSTLGTVDPFFFKPAKLTAFCLGSEVRWACRDLSRGWRGEVAAGGGVMRSRIEVTWVAITLEMGEAVSSAKARARSSAGVRGFGALELRTLAFFIAAGAATDVVGSSSSPSEFSESSSMSASPAAPRLAYKSVPSSPIISSSSSNASAPPCSSNSFSSSSSKSSKSPSSSSSSSSSSNASCEPLEEASSKSSPSELGEAALVGCWARLAFLLAVAGAA